MRFKQLIQGLCDRLSLVFPFESEHDSADQSFELFADDRLISIQQRKDDLWMFTSLGEIPITSEEKQRKYRALLLACGSGAVQYGAAISLDQPSNRVLVHQRLPMNALSVLDLEHALERFLLSVDHYSNTF